MNLTTRTRHAMPTRLLAIVLAALVTGCASVAQLPADYAGADAGRVVIGIGAHGGTSYPSYSLLFRTRDPAVPAAQAGVGRFTYFQTNMFYKQAPDYRSSREEGVVLVRALPPGEYEIYNFNIYFNTGMVEKNFGARVDVAIPFTVKTGVTTYLGNYQANGQTGKNVFGMPLPAGAVFAVSDRLADDLALAQAKAAAPPGAAVNATPDPARLGHPYFVPLRDGGALYAR